MCQAVSNPSPEVNALQPTVSPAEKGEAERAGPGSTELLVACDRSYGQLGFQASQSTPNGLRTLGVVLYNSVHQLATPSCVTYHRILS